MPIWCPRLFIFDFDAQTLRIKLLHMIVSHHGQYEWQSPKRPKFLDAAILHQLDQLLYLPALAG